MQSTRSALTCLSRRTMIQLGSLGLGSSTASLLAANPAAGSRPDTACIMFFLDSGPSHHETFDPKPEAPQPVRGQFDAIDTAVAGLRICDRLPLLAAQDVAAYGKPPGARQLELGEAGEGEAGEQRRLRGDVQEVVLDDLEFAPGEVEALQLLRRFERVGRGGDHRAGVLRGVCAIFFAVLAGRILSALI